MATQPVPEITTLAAMINSLCSQIMAYQAAMDARTENPGVPTLQDVNLQCKIINTILRLHKQITLFQKAANPDVQTENATRENNTPAVADTKYNFNFEPDPPRPPGAPDRQEYVYGDPPPLSRKDFEAYKHILKNYRSGNKRTTVKFNGKHVNKQWLEFNLLNYYLDVMERRFIPNETQYHTLVDHETIKDVIQNLLAQERQRQVA